MAATLTISPSTVTPGAFFTASGAAQRKSGASPSCRILVENVVKSTFSVGPNGKYSKQIAAPTGADRTVQVILQQLQGTGQWATTAPAATLTIQGSVPAPQPTIPTVPLSLSGVAGNTTVALSWSAPTSNGGSALTGYIAYKNGALLANIAAGTTTYTAVGLVNGTDYQFSVAAKNAIGTGPQTSPPITVRPVAPADTTPPIISNVAKASITQSSAVISWVTNELASGQVYYGPSVAYAWTTALEPNFLPSHVQTITSGLTAGTRCYFQIRSINVAGLLSTWADSFDTLPLSGTTPSAPITVTTDNVTIEDKSFTAPTNSGFGIYADGSYTNTVLNLTIRRCTFKGFRTAISLEHVTNLVIEDCIIEDAQYAGILGYSVIGGRISRNKIRRIGMTLVGNNNAYGIALSRNAVASFVTDPRSSNVTVDHNEVEDVPLWHALDTHAGQGIIFEDNIIRRTPRAVFLTGDGIGSRGIGNIARRNRLEQAVTGAGGTNKSGVTLSDQTDPTVTDNAISSTYVIPVNTPSDHPSSGTITISGNTTIA